MIWEERSVKGIDMQVKPLEYHACEAINMLRGAVQMAGSGVRIFAVTSALAHEGKSSLAFRLAQSLAALGGKRVVFVDCDIRNSRMKKRYRITQKTVGLSDYLCGNASEQEIVYPTENPQLDIIFCGRKAPNPSELVSSALMDELLGRLKRAYDYVIVDTPPVNLVVDATIIAPKCDTTMVVVECGVTEQQDLAHTIDLLERANAKILGIVLNKVDSKNNRYGKYGKYGKRYGYGKYGYKQYGHGEEKR